ncbi:MAG TPA: secondary thiamine-phosphate synthase enzyme YjbQ [Bryobacteraceae bacterium]|nr:secondary thiamine-phosphate synthase enzyme YjbQ [Bryobacteraceae bacterium]
MAAFQKTFRISTRGRADIRDVTPEVERLVAESRVAIGIVNVAGKGSTVGVTTIEYEPGAVADFKRALDQVAPMNLDYAHNERCGDENGYAHLRSALIGTGKSFPVRDGAIGLGTWQQIIFCDFDERPREREITVTVIGD